MLGQKKSGISALCQAVCERGTRFVVVTGGVCSSIGKGVLISSLGTLLKNAGYRTSVMKWDPYLNVDPGTMSPLEHGEVFVTHDGAETDLDLGHYERVLGVHLTKYSSITSGKIFSELLSDERKGAYLGKCIQLVPHVMEAIQRRMLQFALDMAVDFVLIEIGGTVGDMEGEIFLETIRQIRQQLPRNHVTHCHLSLLPYLEWANEVKTKPTQHSVMLLKKAGLVPDMLFLRTEKSISERERKKLSVMCGVSENTVFQVLTHNPIYQLFLDLAEQDVHIALQRQAGIECVRQTNLDEWKHLVNTIALAEKTVRIGLIAKYVGANDPYMSLIEALRSAGYAAHVRIDLVTIDAQELEASEKRVHAFLSTLDAIVIPGGFDKRGVEGKIVAARWAREHNIPFFGICLGMQVMLIEAARSLLGLLQASSIEFDIATPDPIITLIDEQQRVVRKGGTMRLGAYPCLVTQNSHAFQAYQAERIEERHRHRYEFNNDYRAVLEEQGVVVTGMCPVNGLAEIIEYVNHPFMVGVQFHPEYISTPLQPHPLLCLFMQTIVSCKNDKKGK